MLASLHTAAFLRVLRSFRQVLFEAKVGRESVDLAHVRSVAAGPDNKMLKERFGTILDEDRDALVRCLSHPSATIDQFKASISYARLAGSGVLSRVARQTLERQTPSFAKFPFPLAAFVTTNFDIAGWFGRMNQIWPPVCELLQSGKIFCLTPAEEQLCSITNPWIPGTQLLIRDNWTGHDCAVDMCGAACSVYDMFACAGLFANKSLEHILKKYAFKAVDDIDADMTAFPPGNPYREYQMDSVLLQQLRILTIAVDNSKGFDILSQCDDAYLISTDEEKRALREFAIRTDAFSVFTDSIKGLCARNHLQIGDIIVQMLKLTERDELPSDDSGDDNQSESSSESGSDSSSDSDAKSNVSDDLFDDRASGNDDDDDDDDPTVIGIRIRDSDSEKLDGLRRSSRKTKEQEKIARREHRNALDATIREVLLWVDAAREVGLSATSRIRAPLSELTSLAF